MARKLGKKNLIAIIAGVVCGITLCMVLIWVALDISKYVPSTRLYDEHTVYKFNPRILLNAIKNGEQGLFFNYDSKWGNYPSEEILVSDWNEANYLSILPVFFNEYLDENIDNWKLVNIQYEFSGYGSDLMRISSATYELMQFDDTGDYPVSIYKEIEIIQDEGLLKLYEFAYDREMFPDQDDFRNLKIKIDEAIQMAEDSGAKKYREEHNISSWNVHVFIGSDSYWQILYSAPNNYAFVKVGINSETGEVKVNYGDENE
ncbi:MAG: hypothetical protein JEZ00_08450 [Anaerolineaceae bacterium]|nr:hypothetical protein [Anaerolineaceae bacterium]